MKMWIRIFQKVLSLILLGLISCGAAVPVVKNRKIEILLKEGKDLQNNLQKFLERLSIEVRGLEGARAQSVKSIGPAFKPLEKFTQFLHYRFQEFFAGLRDAAHIFWTPPSFQWGAHVLAWGISLFVGFVSVLIGRWCLEHRVVQLVHSTHRRSFRQLTLLTSLLFIPLVVYIGLSMTLGYVLWSFKMASLNAWYLNCGVLLPFHMYLLWSGLVWIKNVLAPHRPAKAMISMDPYGAHYVAFSLRTALILYFCVAILFSVMESFPVTAAMMRTFLDTAVLLVGFCVFKALSLMLGHMRKDKEKANLMRIVHALRGIAIIFCLLWIVGREWLIHFLLPILVTGVFFLSLSPLDEAIRRYRVILLWRYRHTTFIFRSFFTSRMMIRRVVRGLLTFALLLLWLGYFWTGDPGLLFLIGQFFFSLLSSLFFTNVFHATVVFFGAFFLVKGGERILKYYVEDKYTSDSLENNFLASRLKTLMAMLKTLLRVSIWVPAISIIFMQFGEINITAWATSLGAATLGLSFGFQSIVRDFITGFFIILENNLMVGDEVEVDQRTGKVEAITLRTLKIRSDAGVLLTIPFGSIVVIGNKNRQFSAVLMNISVGYTQDLDKVQSLIERAFLLTRRMPVAGRRISGALEIRGVNEVTSYSVVFQIKINTFPNAQDLVRRAFNRQLKMVFDEAGVVVPIAPHTVLRASPSLTNTVL